MSILSTPLSIPAPTLLAESIALAETLIHCWLSSAAQKPEPPSPTELQPAIHSLWKLTIIRKKLSTSPPLTPTPTPDRARSLDLARISSPPAPSSPISSFTLPTSPFNPSSPTPPPTPTLPLTPSPSSPTPTSQPTYTKKASELDELFRLTAPHFAKNFRTPSTLSPRFVQLLSKPPP